MDREFTQTIETYGHPFSVSTGKEAEEAFKTVGIVVRAKIERLCNERRYEEAKELEKALITINNADYNH